MSGMMPRWQEFMRSFPIVLYHQISSVDSVPKRKKNTLSAKTKAVPVAKVSRDAGINLHWSADSKKLSLTLGNELFTDELDRRFLFLSNELDSVPPVDTVGRVISLKVMMDKPTSKMALLGADVITMKDENFLDVFLCQRFFHYLLLFDDNPDSDIPLVEWAFHQLSYTQTRGF